MEVKSRMFNEDLDYSVICAWYEERELPVMEEDMLSKFGVMVTVNGKNTVCCFLYPILGASWCIFEGAISNPKSTKEERAAALNVMSDTLHEIAKGMGFKKVLAISRNSGIVSLAQKCGYASDGKEYFNYWGVI